MVGVRVVQALRHGNPVNTEPFLLSGKRYFQKSKTLRFTIIMKLQLFCLLTALAVAVLLSDV